MQRRKFRLWEWMGALAFIFISAFAIGLDPPKAWASQAPTYFGTMNPETPAIDTGGGLAYQNEVTLAYRDEGFVDDHGVWTIDPMIGVIAYAALWDPVFMIATTKPNEFIGAGTFHRRISEVSSDTCNLAAGIALANQPAAAIFAGAIPIFRIDITTHLGLLQTG